MSVQQMMPEDIYAAFLARINKTNMLYETLSEDSSLEMSNTIYFKYYFDISTAIEAVIRGITYEESKQNAYIKYLAEPSSDSKSFFLKYDELKAMINVNQILDGASKETFNIDYCQKTKIIKNYNISKNFRDSGQFAECYNSVRRTRNILAHGLMSLNTVSFDLTTLESFLFVFYLLLSYYKKIISSTN